MRVLAVDPGEKRIGVALSDPTAMIASPLRVLLHQSRQADAAAIADLARQHDVGVIVVGQPLDSEGEVGFQARKSIRVAEAIRMEIDIPVVLWDESGSTQAARAARIAMGARRKNRQGHMDEMAAVYILQTYLDHLHDTSQTLPTQE